MGWRCATVVGGLSNGWWRGRCQAAREAGRPPVECYRAGVEAWRRHHPDQAPEYAAKRAVAVILAHNIELKVGE